MSQSLSLSWGVDESIKCVMGNCECPIHNKKDVVITIVLQGFKYLAIVRPLVQKCVKLAMHKLIVYNHETPMWWRKADQSLGRKSACARRCLNKCCHCAR